MKIKLLMFIPMTIIILTACNGKNDDSMQSAPAQPTMTEVIESENPPSLGETLFTQFYDEVGFSCANCHYVNSDTRLLGPGLLSVEERFATYNVESADLEAYLTESILSPQAFIVPNDSPYPPNLMPRTYGDIFSEEEIDAIISYILAQ